MLPRLFTDVLTQPTLRSWDQNSSAGRELNYQHEHAVSVVYCDSLICEMLYRPSRLDVRDSDKGLALFVPRLRKLPEVKFSEKMKGINEWSKDRRI